MDKNSLFPSPRLKPAGKKRYTDSQVGSRQQALHIPVSHSPTKSFRGLLLSPQPILLVDFRWGHRNGVREKQTAARNVTFQLECDASVVAWRLAANNGTFNMRKTYGVVLLRKGT